MTEKRSRTSFTKRQLAALKAAFNTGGLNRRGKTQSTEIDKLSGSLKLTSKQVTTWIGNKQRQQSGKKYPRRPALTRNRNGYNLYCHKKSKEGIGCWARGWSALPMEEKQKFDKQAKGWSPVNEDNKEATIKNIKKELFLKTQQLEKLGTHVTCLAVDKTSLNEVDIIGNGPGSTFLSSKCDEFLTFCRRAYSEQEAAATVSAASIPKPAFVQTELQQKVQQKLNTAYSEFRGKIGKFPYKQVAAGKLIVQGLPEEITSLNSPSCYGEEKLNSILSANITLSRPNTDTPTISGNDIKMINGKILSPVEVLQELSRGGVNLVEVENGTVSAPADSDAVSSRESASVSVDLLENDTGSMSLNSTNFMETDTDNLPMPKREKSQNMYEIEAILNVKKKNRKPIYLVHWKGYDKSKANWQKLPKTTASLFGY